MKRLANTLFSFFSIKQPSLFILIFFLFGIEAFAQTTGDYRTNANTAWSTLTTWQRWSGSAWLTPTVGEGYPGQNAVPTLVTIQNNHAINLDVSPANNIGSLVIGSGVNANASTLTLDGANILTVTNGISIAGGSASGADKFINVGSGTLSCASITIAATGSNNRNSGVTLSTGTITVAGSITMGDSRDVVTFSGAGIINIGSTGTMSGGTFTASTGTINYSGTNQTVGAYNYHHLTFSNSGTKTLLVGTTTIGGNLTLSGTATATTVVNLAITGNLVVGSGTTFTTGSNFTLGVTGTTDVTGTLTLANTGTKTFTGDVTLNSSGVWNETGVALINYGGNFTNNATTFTPNTGTHTFTGTTKTLSGGTTTSIANVSVTGTYTNNGTLSVTTLLSGAGTLTNGSAGTLNLSGAAAPSCSIANLANAGIINRSNTGTTTTGLVNFTNTGTINISGSGAITGITNNAGGIVNHSGSSTFASFNNATSTSTLNISTTPTVPTFTALTVTAAGNTVNYNGAGNQTVRTGNYQNLTLSVSGTKTLLVGTTAIGGNLTLSGTATATTVANLAITGNLVVGSGTTFTTGANFTLGVTGTTDVTGTLTLANTGAKTFTGDVTLNSGGVWNETGVALINYGGSLTNNATTFTANTGTHTFSGATKILSGATVTSIPTITFTGNYTNSGTLSCATLLTVTGGTIRLTNTGTVTSSLALSGTGGVTQGTNGILNIGGASGITTLDAATTNNNTVNFSGTGLTQAVKIVTYCNLALSGAGDKTFTGLVTVNKNLSISGTAIALLPNTTTSTASTLTLGGVSQINGFWGGTGSTAPNQSATYFGTTTSGVVNVGTNCSTQDVTGFSAPLATPVCNGTGSDVTVNSANLLNGTYTVRYNVSGTNTVASTTASMIFSGGTGTFTTASLSNSGSSNVVNITSVTSSLGCVSDVTVSTAAFTTSTSPTPTFTSQPGSPICAISDVTYTTQSGQSNYSWTLSGTLNTDYSITSGGVGSADHTVTLKWLTFGSKTVTVNYSSGGCSGISAASSSTSVNVAPTITLASSATSVCSSGSAQTTPLTYSAKTNSPTTYSITWNASPTNSFATVTDAALPTSPITINVPASTAAGTYTGNLTVKNANGCVSSSSSFTVTVVGSAPNVSNLSASLVSSCSGNGIVVSVSSTSLASGTYTVTYDLIATGGGSQSNATATMIFTSGSPGTGSFTTVAYGGSAGTVDITFISAGGCSSPVTFTPPTSISNVSSPDASGLTSVTASSTDIGNTSGSTVLLVASQVKISAGTYTVGYNVTDAATGLITYITGSQSITFVVSTKRNRLSGTFFTGMLGTAGTYRVNITSISAGTGCSSTVTGLNATFSVVGGFITQKTGLWDETGVWSSSGAGPNYTAGTIIIGVGHTITFDATAIAESLQLDELIIRGTLIITSDQLMILKNGTGTDMTIESGGKLQIGTTTNTGTINGTLDFETGVTHSGTSSTTVEFKTQSLYEHLSTTTEGSPPLATWASNSVIQVKGYTSTDLIFASSGWSQSFGEFIWSCQSQTSDISLKGLLGALNAGVRSIQGSVTVTNTGTGIVRLGDVTDYSLTISGNLVVSGTSRFSTGPDHGSGPTIILNVSNITYSSSGNSWLCEAGQATINVSGNVQISSGTVYLSDGGNNISTSGGTINLTGNLTVDLGATLDASSSNSNRTGRIIYNNLPLNGTKTHLHTINGSVVGYMQYQIVTDQTVRTVNESSIFSLRAVPGTFTMDAGSTLIVESTDANGAIQAGNTAGNLRVPTLGRSFAVGSTIEYGRTFTTAGQFIGSGHPATSTVDCRINNSSGVTVSSTGGSVIISGSLKVVSGNLTVKENNVTVLQNTETSSGNIIVNPRTAGSTTAFRTDGAINMTGGNIQMNSSATVNAANDSLIINGDLLGTNNFVFSGSNCQVTIGGSTRTFSRNFPISGPDSLEYLTMNSAGTTLIIPFKLTLGNTATNVGGLRLTNGNIQMNADLLVTSDAILTNGILYFENHQVEFKRNIQPSAAGLFSSNASSVLLISGTFNGTTTDSLLFTPSGNTLGTLILNRSVTTSIPNILVNSPFTIANFLYLTDGEFEHESGMTMAGGATIVRTGQARFSTASAAPLGTYNVVYNNYTTVTDGPSATTTSLTTSAEAQGSLNNMTSNLTGTATVASSISGIGTLTVNTGIFTCVGFPVSMNSTLIIGTLNAPVNNALTLTSTFTNNGTFTSGGGTSTVAFSGTTLITGSSLSSFNNILISTGTLAPSSALLFEVAGSFVNSGAFNGNLGTVRFNGASGSISGNTPNFYNLIVSSGTLTSSSGSISIASTFTNDAAFIHNGGAVIFNGTSTAITGSSLSSFNNLSISSGTLTPTSALLFEVAGSFVNSGVFNGNLGTVRFNGGTASISGNAPNFYHLIISSGALTSSSGNINVAGTFTNNASFIHNNGTVTFNGVSTSIGGSSLIGFNNILISSGTLTPASSLLFEVAGSFVNSATFNGNLGTVQFNGSSASISGNPPNFYHVTISSGTLTSSSGIINVAGNFTDNATFVPNNGTVNFNGTSLSSIAGSALPVPFQNITASNAVGVSVDANSVDLHGVLTVAAGNFDADGAGASVFSLRSTGDAPDITASVAPLIGTISGNVRVERYMSPESRLYRYISSPLSDGMVSDWMDNFPITGDFLDPSSSTQWGTVICGLEFRSGVPSLYFYDEKKAGVEDVGYVQYPGEGKYSYESPIRVGRGYSSFIRECNSATVVDVRGAINSGNLTLPATFTPHSGGLGLGDGWNLMGNPYPSAVNWDDSDWTKTNISPTISIRDNASGMQRYFTPPFDGSDDFNGVIASGQAFWVRATNTPSLIIREGVKVSGVSHDFYRVAGSTTTNPFITISLSHGIYTDKVVIKQSENALVELDDWDAPKLKNENYGVSALTPMGRAMAISAVPEVKEGMLIPIKIADAETGEYKFTFTASENFAEYSIELTDELLGIKKILNWNESYNFSFNTKADGNRFNARLVRYQSSETIVLKVIAYPNPLKDVLNVQLPPDGLIKAVMVYNQNGLKIEERVENPESQISEISFTSRPSGVYLIRLVGPGYNLLTKVIKE